MLYDKDGYVWNGGSFGEGKMRCKHCWVEIKRIEEDAPLVRLKKQGITKLVGGSMLDKEGILKLCQKTVVLILVCSECGKIDKTVVRC